MGSNNSLEWKDVFNSITDSLILLDSNGKIKDCNVAFLKLVNKTKSQAIGSECNILIHGKADRDDDCPLIRSKRSKKRESLTLKKDDKWFKVDVDPILNEKNKITGFIHIMSDITQSKQTEEALRSEKDNLNNIFESMDDGVYIVDQQHNIQFINSKLQKDFGKFDGRKCYEYFHDRNEVCTWCKNAEVFAGKTVHWEHHVPKNNKTYGLIDTPLKNPDGSISKLEIIRDITDERKAEKAFEDIFNLSPDIVGVFTTKGKLLKVNPSWEKVLGYTTKELLRLNWTTLVHPDDVERTNKEVEKQLNGNSVVGFINRYKCKDGSYKTLEWQATFAKEGIVYATARDITDRRKAEKVISESEEKYRNLFNHMIQGFALHQIVLDEKNVPTDYIFIEVNKTFEIQTGLKRKKIVGKKVTEVLPGIENDPTGWIELYGKVALSGKGIQFDSFSIPLNKWFSVISYCPKKGYFATIFEDITDRKQMEEAHRRSKDLLDSTQKLTKVGGWKFNVEDQSMYWTDETYRIHEIDPTEIEPGSTKHIEQGILCYDEKDRQIILDAFQKCVTSGISYDLEFPFTTVKGNRIIIRTTAQAEKENNKVVSITGNIMDITERKQIEYKLKEAKDFAENMLETANSFVLILDSKANITTFNKFAEELTSYKKAEVLGKNWFDIFIPQEEKKNLPKVFKKVLNSMPEVSQHENNIITKDGEIRMINWNNNLVRDISGKITGVLSIGIDDTERMKIEALLKSNEAQFRGIYEQSPIAIEIYNRKGKLIDVNQTTLDMFGVKEKKYVIGFDLWEDPNLTSEKMEKLKNGEEIFISTDFDFEIVKSHNLYPTSRSGKMFMDMYSIPLKNDKEIIGYLVQLVEITERKKAEEELKQSEEKYRTLVETVREGIGNVDNDETFTFVNQAGADIFGYSKEELLGKNLKELATAESYQKILKESALRKEGRSTQYEFEIIRKNGEQRSIVLTGSPIISENGELKGSFGIFHDITERKQAEEDLRKGRERLALLNKIIRHDLSNDFMVIKSAINLYKRSSEENMIDEIEGRVKKSLKTIENYRKYETFISSNADLEGMEITELVNSIMPDFPKIKFKIGGTCKVFADDALSTVFTNLISNSIKHGEATEIEIKITSENNMCEIRFMDNGKGIPDKIKHKIFNEGFTFGKSGHTGIGLHLVKETIDRYGGYVYAEDNMPRGAVFVISLRKVLKNNPKK